MPASSEIDVEGRPNVVVPVRRFHRTAVRKAGAVGSRVELCCGDCGYGVVVTRLPARCPMCGGQDWGVRPDSSSSSLASNREGW